MGSQKLNFFMEDIDYPREELYSSINEIFSQRSFVITPQILKSLEPAIKDGLVLMPNADRSFVRILLKLEQMEKVIRWAVTEEVANCNKREIFRENTLASHLLTWTFRIAGEEFLADCLREFILDLLSSSDNLEIDQNLLEASGDASKNKQALTTWTTKLINKLSLCFKSFPPFLSKVIGIVQEIILERFKDELDKEEITRNVIMNFLILRYISLALVSPSEYDLIRPSMLKTPKQKRNLVLIAKMITAIAYGNHFRSSFEVMNQTVDAMSPRFQTIYTEISQVGKEENGLSCSEDTCKEVSNVPSKLPSSESMGEDVAILIKYLQAISIDKIVVESLNVFYKHIIENTGLYSIPEMMEMLTCFSKLKWIVRTDWFTEKTPVRNLMFPKAIQRVLEMVQSRERSGSKEYVSTKVEGMDVEEWFHAQYPKYRFAIYIFYRGFFCTGCKKWLAEWNDLADIIRKAGGDIFAITAESESAARSTKQKWNLKFDIVSDPSTKLAETNNITVEDAAAAGWTLLGDYGPKFSQPGIVCLNPEGSVVYFWKQNPNAANIFGGTGRAVPIESLVSILEAVDFDERLMEGPIRDIRYNSIAESSSYTNGSSSSSSVSKFSRSVGSIGEVDDVASAILSMNKVEIHKLVTSVVKEDEVAVNLYEEVMNQKKKFKESEKRMKKEKKLEKKKSSSSLIPSPIVSKK